MSRSKRKTPLVSVFCAESDKWYKVLCHRKFRRAAKVSAAVGQELPSDKAFFSRRESPKEYKLWKPKWMTEAHIFRK